MKNILILHHSNKISGAEKSLLDFLKVVTTRGKNYQFFVACPGNGLFVEQLRRLNLRIISLNIIRLKKTPNIIAWVKYIIHVLFITILLRKIFLINKIDLIHANTTISFLQGILAAKLWKVPIIWHVRDMLNLPLCKPVLEKLADHIIPISKAVAETLYNPGSEKVSIIKNGILVEQSAQKIILDQCDIYEERYLLMIAQFAPWKRHDLLVEAFSIIQSDMPDLKLIFVGEDLFCEHDKYMKKLKKIICRENLNEKTIFTGFHENVYDFINNCEILVHPAEKEPLGRIVIEAMMLNKPVIAADNGGITDYVENGINGFLFKSGNVKDLIRVIIYALNHQQLKMIKANAVKTANSLFNLSNQSERVLDVYSSLIKKHINSVQLGGTPSAVLL